MKVALRRLSIGDQWPFFHNPQDVICIKPCDHGLDINVWWLAPDSYEEEDVWYSTCA